MPTTIRIEKNREARLQIMQSYINEYYYTKEFNSTTREWEKFDSNVNHIVNGSNEVSASAAIAKAIYDIVAGCDKKVNIFVFNAESLSDSAKQALNKLMQLIVEGSNAHLYIVIDPKDFVTYRNEIKTSKTAPIQANEKPLREWHKLSKSGQQTMESGCVTYPTQAEGSFLKAVVKNFVSTLVK